MKQLRNLSTAMKPTQHAIVLDVDEQLIALAEQELQSKAKSDDNQCYGYFPGMAGRQSIDTSLPQCQALYSALRHIRLAGKELDCNFIRLSLIKQQGNFPFHLDTDAATALTGDRDTLHKRKVWRLLLNLSAKHSRTLSYIDVDPNTVELDYTDGYLHCVDEASTNKLKKSIKIPPRSKAKVSGVLFCSSRVLHTGVDDHAGHFVAGFGYEEMV